VDTIRQTVNRNLMTLTLIERAVNQPEGWTVQIGSEVVSAQVIVADGTVTFWASFPAMAGVEPRALVAHGGELRAVVPVDSAFLGDRFEFEWTLAVGETINA
jgi:hypothetical protein